MVSLMKKKLKVNIVVGGRFHSEQTYFALTDLGFDVKIYASSPKRYFKSIPNKDIIFIPKLFQAFRKCFKIRLHRYFDDISSLIFDFTASLIMRQSDIIWGFNGDSFLSGRKLKINNPKGIYIVDRACPHFLKQENLMMEESKELNYPYLKHSRWTRKRFCDEYTISDMIVVPSNYTLKSFLEFGYTTGQVCVAPLDASAFIDRKHIQNNSLSQFSSNHKDQIKVGFVGGAFLRKGIIYLLRSLDYLENHNILLVIRANKDSIYCHREAYNLCMKHNVIFLPYQENMANFYNLIDIFVLPSIEEGFGMVLFEALKSKVPVIASSNVGSIDGLVNGKEYLQIQPKDSLGLAKAIESIVEDPVLRKEIATNGHQAYNLKNVKGSMYKNSIEEMLLKLGVKS